jgi:transposase
MCRDGIFRPATSLFIAEKKAASELNVESREKVFNSLKGNKYTILKAEYKLTDKQKIKLDTIREASPLIAIMHSLKEEFRNLFDTSEDAGTGILGLLDWLEKAAPYYQKSVNTAKSAGGSFPRRALQLNGGLEK